MKAKHLFTSAAGNEYNKVSRPLIYLCGHKPEGHVEHETLGIITSTESVCFHHFQLTPLIVLYKADAFKVVIFTTVVVQVQQELPASEATAVAL